MSSTATGLASPEALAKYEPVIGLEVHVQLATPTKIFCGCPTSFGAAPNTNVCPVCLGLPGALPVLNRHAVELAIKAALALELHSPPHVPTSRARTTSTRTCRRATRSRNTTSRWPSTATWTSLLDGVAKRIGVTRVHMEDDAGKSIHDGFKDSDRYTYVDLNRSGTPLIEIVSEPDMRTSDEAYAYLTEIKQVMQFVEVSTCDMEKGHLRCDANVSVRLKGAEKFGTKAEVKNLNSFRFLKLALDYEIARQVALIESGGRVVQETRLYNPDQRRDRQHAQQGSTRTITATSRSRTWCRCGSATRGCDRVRAQMPELPASQARKRFVGDYGLREYDAEVLTSTRAMSEYFEKVAATAAMREAAANWVMGDLLAMRLKAEGKEIEESPVSAAHLGELVGPDRQRRDLRQAGQGHFPEDVRRRRRARRHHASARA